MDRSRTARVAMGAFLLASAANAASPAAGYEFNDSHLPLRPETSEKVRKGIMKGFLTPQGRAFGGGNV
jgi:hypothetical protein